jgi:uncharacterized protein YjbI with pentapeptide repeats
MKERQKQVDQRLLWALAGLVGSLLVFFALVVGPWVFTRQPHHGLSAYQELQAKNDVRSTLVQVLGGLAVAGGLIVTYRTFRHNRIEQDRTYALRQTEQVNESYSRAVGQLGDEHAPVRLGALYSLVHLAQANPQQRQTVVDVLCAYLRMPYTPPMPDEPTIEPLTAVADAPVPWDSAPKQRRRDGAQELQVRQTAQRLIAVHLRRPRGTSSEDAQGIKASPDTDFWPGISLDLSGATLVDLDLTDTSLVKGVLTRATFTGDAKLDGATFTGDADFSRATFSGEAQFIAAKFTARAAFDGTTFARDAHFSEATFCGGAQFVTAKFNAGAAFDSTRFTDGVRFNGASFGADAWFGLASITGGSFKKVTFTTAAGFFRTTFDVEVYFIETTFTGEAGFQQAVFSSCADFRNVTFTSAAYFDDATFTRDVRFVSTTFAGSVLLGSARFAFMPAFDETCVVLRDDRAYTWPPGWRLIPDDPTPGRGLLAYFGPHEPDYGVTAGCWEDE